MATVEGHAADCKKILGKPYWEVHRFLDKYAEAFPVGHFVDYHRTFLHNSYGLKIVEAKWGPEAKTAAFIHLYRDYHEGPVDHLSLEKILERVPRAVMWFNRMMHGYEPRPHIIKAWNGKSLVHLATKEEKDTK